MPRSSTSEVAATRTGGGPSRTARSSSGGRASGAFPATVNEPYLPASTLSEVAKSDRLRARPVSAAAGGIGQLAGAADAAGGGQAVGAGVGLAAGGAVGGGGRAAAVEHRRA